jgi:uncharacterized membrane protein
MNRLAYIDWMRGLACVLMFQTHCYDSWLSPEVRQSGFFQWSQKLGTFPAPLFLFLAGVSFALVTQKLREKGMARAGVARQTMLRGAEIFSLALLFRVQEFLLGQPHAPWSDLLRVDILNLMGLSMVLMGGLCWLRPTRAGSITGALLAMMAVILVTPWLWTTQRPRFLPWPVESYINGVHIFAEPQAWLFPIFPWAGFGFAGLAAGFVLGGSGAGAKSTDGRETHRSPWSTEGYRQTSLSSAPLRGNPPLLLGTGGAALALGAWWLDTLPVHIYPVYDFWHTSPNFFLLRLGLLLMILCGCYAWCQWGWGARGWSPMMELGRESLLVYWVHIQLVYGGLSILEKRAQTATSASVGLGIITLAMLALALGRRKWKARRARL